MFVDSSYGWASGDSGVIINTTNAGTTWSLQQSGINSYKIEELFFVNRRIGWAISNDYLFIGTFLLTTTNGGSNWNVYRFPDSAQVFNTIFFFDSLKGFISGQTGQIYRTINGGTNWIPCGIDSSGCPHLLPKHDLLFINSLTGFSGGGAIDYTGIIWKTTNSGLNWAAFCLTPEPLNVIKNIGTNKVVIMGGDFEFGANILYSSNNGNSWNYELTNCFGYATGFSFRTPAECWAVLGAARMFTVNLDSARPGTHWECLPSPEGEEIYDIEFTSPTLGWAFGSNGSIFKYNTAIIGINGNQNILPGHFKLFQNYPNPFNPETKIIFQVPASGYVKLTVYDAAGNEISVLINRVLIAGTYEVVFDGSRLASGIYYYKLSAGGFFESKKMVLIK